MPGKKFPATVHSRYCYLIRVLAGSKLVVPRQIDMFFGNYLYLLGSQTRSDIIHNLDLQ